jgi:hypothetical protein
MPSLEQTPRYLRSCTSPQDRIKMIVAQATQYESNQHAFLDYAATAKRCQALISEATRMTHPHTFLTHSIPGSMALNAHLILSGRSRHRTGCMPRWPSLLHVHASQTIPQTLPYLSQQPT